MQSNNQTKCLPVGKMYCGSVFPAKPIFVYLEEKRKLSVTAIYLNYYVNYSVQYTIGKISVYKHCFCYSNMQTTRTKDPLFRHPMRLWLAQ